MDTDETVDVVGVGFGPSNLALAIAIEEHNGSAPEGERITSVFLEKQRMFGWHRGMLLPGAAMQVSFLKDLVTQRNARSGYSFLSYLAEMDRLTHFINLQSFFPSRLEFHDYLEWAATKVSCPVLYAHPVTDVRWAGDVFEVTAGAGRVVRARNVVLAGGIVGRLPQGVVTGPRVFHSHGLLHRLAELAEPTRHRFVVVGSGQSAAEVTAHLHSTYPLAEVHAVFSKYGFTPADDSPYANRIFDPEAVADFHGSSEDLRRQLLDYHHSTNYSAVDLELIEELYNREYCERVAGRRRLFVHGASELVSQDAREDGVTVRVKRKTTGETETLECDAVVYATGFRPRSIEELGLSIAPYCAVDAADRPVIDGDYRVCTDPAIRGSVFVQGNTEHTHGLTSTLLSNVAIRSGEIVATLAETKYRPDNYASTEGETVRVHQSV